MFQDKDPGRIFLTRVGQGANMVNACFLNWKGKKPLGGIMPFLGMVPLSWSEIDSYNPNFEVLQQTPILITIGGNDPTLPESVATQSYTYYYIHLYQTAAAKSLYKGYNNPGVFPKVGSFADLYNENIVLRNKKFLEEYLKAEFPEPDEPE